jgi:hypothetical protein
MEDVVAARLVDGVSGRPVVWTPWGNPLGCDAFMIEADMFG